MKNGLTLAALLVVDLGLTALCAEALVREYLPRLRRLRISS